MGALVKIDTVNLRGETIKEAFFIDMADGDKMIIVFGSGKVLVMPVHRACPVQVGSMADLSGDFDDFLRRLEKDKARLILDTNNTIERIVKLKNWYEKEIG